MSITKILKIACLTIPCLCAPCFISGVDSFSTYELAEFYHNHSLQQWEVAYTALQGYSFQGDESVLEIGCRSGRVAANVAGRVPQGEVIASEMRGQGAIQFATQNHAKESLPKFNFSGAGFSRYSF